MGVKYTITLSRKEAETKLIDIETERCRQQWKRVLPTLGNDALEDLLERENTEANYEIKPE